MGMLLNRLVKRDSTQPAYSSDHANLPTSLFINDLTKYRDCSSPALSNISLKLTACTIKGCWISGFHCNSRNMLLHSASFTELADISYFCCTDIQTYQSLLESPRDRLALAARLQSLGFCSRRGIKASAQDNEALDDEFV